MESQSKITRTKLVENSRQKFYENLNQHYKDNKDAPSIQAPLTQSIQNLNKKPPTNQRLPSATKKPVTKETNPKTDTFKRQDSQTETMKSQAAKSAVEKKAPRPQSTTKNSRAARADSNSSRQLNKDLAGFSQNSSKRDLKQEGQAKENLTNNKLNVNMNTNQDQKKTAPSFSTKMPYSNIAANKDGDLSASISINNATQITKKSTGFREQLIEQIKENIGNPKKLQELQQRNTHLKVDFQQLIHQAKVQILKDNKTKAAVSTVDEEIAKRIENSRKLLARLRAVKPSPPYANSILQSAINNKSRIIEAHLSTMNDDIKKYQINQLDEEHARSAVFYAAFYGSVEAIELLAASDANLNLTDKYHRTPLHYAAMNDNKKIIEAVFMGFKQQGKPIKIHGQVDEDSNSPTKSVPKATFTPFKGLHDKMDEERKKAENLKQLQKQWEEEENKMGDDFEDEDNGGFEIEDDQQDQFKESFKVQIESPAQGKTGNMMNGLGNFFTQKAVLDVQDEKKDTMYEEMNKIDKLYIPQSELKKKTPKKNDQPSEEDEFIGVPQVSLNGIINFRDLNGRTALHVAVAFNNKNAVETLLFLNANPLIEDKFGQRPVEFALDDAIRDLLQNKMIRATNPVLVPTLKIKPLRGNPNQNLSIKPRKMSQVSSQSMQSSVMRKDKNQATLQQFPLEIKDLRVVLKEKVIISKIGIENDNYLQHAIKNKGFEACLYLLQEIGGFEFSYKNSVGNTVLHLAIKTNQYQYVKMLFVKQVEDMQKHLQSNRPDDLYGLINEQALRLLDKINNKGMTPLLMAVDQGNFEIFRLLLEIYYYNDSISKPEQKLLPKIINLKDDKSDTCLLKAVKSKQTEMIYSLLQLGNSIINYEVLLETDSVKRNILHYATINANKDMIKILVKLDSDRMEMRLANDSKKKTPQNYDQSSSMTECFNTIWDYAKEGNLRKLKLSIDSGKFEVNEQTPWRKDTPLHVAVRVQQLEVIKCLIYDYDADINIQNNLGKSPIQMANALKDEPTQIAITGLLNKLHTSTKVIKNLQARREKEEDRLRQIEEINRLRRLLNDKIQERGLDLARVFKMFDKNGDEVFSPMEFELAFVALDIDISKADLRRFISLTDTNKDGRVDFKEFYAMLNKESQVNDLDNIGKESEVDFDASIEEIEDN
ncbi:ankyrin repeat [Stylonychia lemnae]|uniref:Ankyrin repeat n=1 Tax=Stylonychia lemnae TaxID=5949 RepID=A0A078AEQ6_STYLE|nr:ankyrin repeat [Stylonychia lemnae]|eukprot:CDW79967.1 ankyrin repeat [Stylonychia lemnae]